MEFRNKGNTAFKNSDYVTALALYSQAVNAEPANHLHYSNRSLCYYFLEKYEEALNDAVTCINLCPNWGKGYFRKGQAEAKLNKVWEAFVSFSINLLLESHDLVSNELLAQFVLIKDQIQDFVNNNPSNPYVIKLTDENQLKGIEIPENIFEKAKAYPDFRFVLSQLYNIDKTIIDKDIEHYFICKVQTESPDKRRSQEEYEVRIKEKLSKGEAAFHKANDLFVFEEYEEALANYDTAINSEHNNIHYLLNRAACYLKLGDDSLALEDCNYALKRGLNSARVYYLKAQAYQVMKKLDLAKETNKEGLVKYPNDEGLLKQQTYLEN